MNAQVGRRIRIRRLSLNLSQPQLARLLGVSFQQIQKYETGSNTITASRLYELSWHLNVPIQYFFEECGYDERPDALERHTTQIVTDFLTTVEGAALNRSFAQIGNTAVRRKLLNLISALSGAAR